MHEEDFWSSWLREDERGKEAERNEEKKGEKRTREEEDEENETGTVKRRCEGCFFLWRLLRSLVKGEIWRVLVACPGGSLGEA